MTCLNKAEGNIILDDDFIKFTRFGQHLIDQTGIGVMCFISNHTYISGLTHRQMRASLIKSFSKIRIIDIHGSKVVSEQAPDNEFDEYKWVSYWYPLFIIVSFKKEVYRSILNELKQLYCNEIIK